ncbi:MAG: hypothetical protein ACJ8FS_16165 [Sphingomicrobium sp.]
MREVVWRAEKLGIDDAVWYFRLDYATGHAMLASLPCIYTRGSSVSGSNGSKTATPLMSALGGKLTLGCYPLQMIWNLIDRRKRQYRWKSVNAIIEAVEHDNACEDADQAPDDADGILYAERASISVADAVAWANEETSAVTLYLYDEGDGISAKKPKPH